MSMSPDDGSLRIIGGLVAAVAAIYGATAVTTFVVTPANDMPRIGAMCDYTLPSKRRARHGYHYRCHNSRYRKNHNNAPQRATRHYLLVLSHRFLLGIGSEGGTSPRSGLPYTPTLTRGVGDAASGEGPLCSGTLVVEDAPAMKNRKKVGLLRPDAVGAGRRRRVLLPDGPKGG